MEKNLIEIKYRQQTVGIKTYKTKYYAHITHKGLNDFILLSAEDSGILQSKVNSQVAKLEDKWSKIVYKENVYKSKEASVKEAEERTEEAILELKKIDEILLHTLDINDTVDWELLKDKTKFKIPSPERELSKLLSAISKPKEPSIIAYPNKPEKENYVAKLSFFDKLITSKKNAKISHSNDLYEHALWDWRMTCQSIDRDNENLNKQYQSASLQWQKQIEAVKQTNSKDVIAWEKSKADFIKSQEQTNAKVEVLKVNYLNLEPTSVLEYCELVLNNSEYPEYFPKSFELDYTLETKILIVEYSLPSIEQLPTLNEVKYIKNELKEYYISEAQILKLFDATMYRITLRTIHELFEADVANALEAISFNGWVNAVNKATGKRENNCILSIQAKKSEFMEINLRHVDPKTCFKNFKGVGSSKLSGLTPIQPILQISRTDKRFVNHYEVANSIDSSTNLASMDWEDFEHLIREVFAKEFNANGGEVKVTQASRDGGVDAIAFDPDPIRGGKIVIQAKRYTNTVGVAAVRDLYGTVMNEGATKGILVTTADYGPDAYDFVKGKPLTLMNGSNLLYLLEKHGHQARIDIKEAKRIMS